MTCMEMLEHVPDPAKMTATLATLVKPGGDLFVSTINRNLKSFCWRLWLRKPAEFDPARDTRVRPPHTALAARAMGPRSGIVDA